MPKIKELTNKELRNYLQSYLALYSNDPKNNAIKVKIEAIKNALKNREINGADKSDDGGFTKTLSTKILSLFNKGK